MYRALESVGHRLQRAVPSIRAQPGHLLHLDVVGAAEDDLACHPVVIPLLQRWLVPAGIRPQLAACPLSHLAVQLTIPEY
eukprot:COSAG01_NODE_1895_length_8971_cov_127.287083_2_plen_80_part_00